MEPVSSPGACHCAPASRVPAPPAGGSPQSATPGLRLLPSPRPGPRPGPEPGPGWESAGEPRCRGSAGVTVGTAGTPRRGWKADAGRRGRGREAAGSGAAVAGGAADGAVRGLPPGAGGPAVAAPAPRRRAGARPGTKGGASRGRGRGRLPDMSPNYMRSFSEGCVSTRGRTRRRSREPGASLGPSPNREGAAPRPPSPE